MNTNILVIALFVILHVAYIVFALKESDNLRPDTPEREAAILDYFRP